MKLSPVNAVAIALVTVLVAVFACWPETKPAIVPAYLAATADVETRSVLTCAKLRLAHDVAAGRRTLWEAAALFGALNRQSPAPKSVVELTPSVPAAEQLCREVVGLVAFVLAEQPPKQAAVIAELEAELQQARNQPGGVQLSEPSVEVVGELITHARDRLGLVCTP
jgi:hypothetical protein